MKDIFDYSAGYFGKAEFRANGKTFYCAVFSPIDFWEPFYSNGFGEEITNIGKTAIVNGDINDERTLTWLRKNIPHGDADEIYRFVRQTFYLPISADDFNELRAFKYILAKSSSNGSSYLLANNKKVFDSLMKIMKE